MITMRFLKLHGIFLIAVAVSLLTFSCRTTREMPATELKSISTSKLLKKVENNALKYDYFTIRRISCHFNDGETKTNFKVNLKALRDEKILVSISKLNLPVGRVLLTPDSVKYVNYMERNYFIDDYSYLSNLLNIDLDFQTIQSIISNNAFSYRNDPKDKDYRTFDSFIESGMYVLQSEKERKLKKMSGEEKYKKVERRMNRLGDDALILQKMFFNNNFTLTKLEISDKSNNKNMEVNFDDFVQVDDNEYPGSIEMNFKSPKNTVILKTNMNGFSTDKIKSFNFRIPEKYNQIRVN